MNLNYLLTQTILAIFVTGVVAYFLYNLLHLSNNETSEGFGGVARGSGVPDCLRDSQEASSLYEIFASQQSTTEEGPDDLREFTQILSKTCCLKKDLMNPSGFVEATRYQPYSTAHDIEQVAETTARCLSKTIPVRDLDIILDKWNTRGKQIIRRLCTSYKLSDNDMNKANKLFKTHMTDINDIAKSKCLKGDVEIAGTKGPRDVSPYTPPGLSELRVYKGYY